MVVEKQKNSPEDELIIPSPQLGPSQVVYEDRNRQIQRVTADFGSFIKEYFIVESGQRAGLVVVRDGSVLLVRQYRLLIDGLSWEIPGGKVDDGESAEEAAIRECLEETGVLCQNVRPLLTFHPGLDSFHNPTHLFYTDDQLQEVRVDPNPEEAVAHEWVPLKRCIDMVYADQIVDSFSIIALLAYQGLVDRQ